MSTKYKISFKTLGCKLNFSETSAIARSFAENGYERVPFTSDADICIINTCTVTSAADKKSRNAVYRARRTNPEAFIIVAGCYPQIKPDDFINIEGVDLILGNNEKFDILKYLDKIKKKKAPDIFTGKTEDLKKFFPSYSYGDRTRSFLKIQDGCDYCCSYCTVPLARGRSRNIPVKDVVAQAAEIAKKGIKEIVLTGVNIGDFGRSTNESFYDLIKELDKIKDIQRFRISSLEPDLVSEKIIRFISHSDRFVPHFHIPLQSGSDKILHLMGRRYKREIFENSVKKILSLMPDACIGADIITGLPGEGEKEFLETYNFIKDLEISYLHVFKYSERDNTKALELKNKVKSTEKTRRSRLMKELSEKKRRFFYKQNLGKEFSVLCEGRTSEGKMLGFTENYIKTEIPYKKENIREILKVRLEKVNERFHVDGEVIE